MITNVWAELSAYSIPEVVAVIASVIYIVLAARNNRYCWPAAFVGSTIFVIVLWQYQLLMDAALNVYYAFMAIYGWLVWNKLAKTNKQTTDIQTWPIKNHILSLSFIAVLSLLSGYWLANHTEASFPYLDSLTTWSSLLATWMVAKKILETWIYWFVIDAISIYLYLNKELYFTTLLFIAYVFIVIYAYFNWKNQQKNQQKNPSNNLTGNHKNECSALT